MTGYRALHRFQTLIIWNKCYESQVVCYSGNSITQSCPGFTFYKVKNLDICVIRLNYNAKTKLRTWKLLLCYQKLCVYKSLSYRVATVLPLIQNVNKFPPFSFKGHHFEFLPWRGVRGKPFIVPCLHWLRQNADLTWNSPHGGKTKWRPLPITNRGKETISSLYLW